MVMEDLAMENQSCPVCLGRIFETLIDFGVLPIAGQFSIVSRREGKNLPLSYEYCTQCGIIRLCITGVSISDYTHFMLTSWRRPAPYIETTILPSLRQAGVETNDLIIEVGANDGTFLDLLRSHGFGNLLAIEPSQRCVGLLKGKSLRHEICHLDRESADRIRNEYGGAGAVICRHTLEHINQPDDFVRHMARLLSDKGIVFVEVPDARALAEYLRGYSLRPEHPYTYSRDNLEYLFQRVGLDVIQTKQDRGGGDDVVMIWARARKAGHESCGSLSCPPIFLERCRTFSQRWREFATDMQEQSVNWPRPVVCLGASYKQVHLLLFSGIGSCVSLLVDDNPDKVGRYAFLPQPVNVISTKNFRQLSETESPGTIIRGAFGYDAWMDTLCIPLQKRGVRFVDPFEILKQRSNDRPIHAVPSLGGRGTESTVIDPLEPAHRD